MLFRTIAAIQPGLAEPLRHYRRVARTWTAPLAVVIGIRLKRAALVRGRLPDTRNCIRRDRSRSRRFDCVDWLNRNGR